MRASRTAGIAFVGGDPAALFAHVTGDDALSVLVRLFLVGLPCDVAAVRDALPGVDLPDLAAGGLVEPRGTDGVTRVRLLACRGLLVASRTEGTVVPADYVMGAGMGTVILANMTVRLPARRMLDLGVAAGFWRFSAPGTARRSLRSTAIRMRRG